MKRKLVSVLLLLVFCLSLPVCAFAAPASDFVVDEFGLMSNGELDTLNHLAGEIYEERGIALFFVFTTADSLLDYDISQLVGDVEDYYIMMENDTSWYTFRGGKGARIDDATEETLRGIYDYADTYAGGVKDFLLAAADCFPVVEVPATEAPAGTTPVPSEATMVFDNADLLSAGEEAVLTVKLTNISEAYGAQVVVATVDSLDGSSVANYAHLYFDTMNFGYGANRDGVMLLVCMNPRQYRIISNGYAAKAISGDEIDAIGEAIVSDLSGGDYASAFGEFAEQSEYYLDGYLNGFPFNFGKSLMIALAVGLVVGLIVVLVLKSQLTSVYQQNQANVYVKENSLQLTAQSDMFLYRTVSKSAKPSKNSSSSGSSRSSGGGSF